MKKLIILIFFSTLPFLSKAQCLVGESEVTIDVDTDAYGYEIYWELVPSGNSCGVGTLFSGGNTAVGCSGGSAQNQAPGGYGNFASITEGPWCLLDGASYDIIFVDDWGDGGASFTVNIGGFPLYTWSSGSGSGTGSVFTFVVTPPQAWDLQGESLTTYNYVPVGNVAVEGQLFNFGSNTITSFDLNYQIDNGTIVTAPLTGLSILPFTTYTFAHPTLWNAAIEGTYSLKVWANNLDGNADMNNFNDTLQKTVIVGPATPNLIDDYAGMLPIQNVIIGATDGVLVPRDLDFHPTLSNRELWVILKSTEGSGGETIKITNAGEVSQSYIAQQDGNAYHFMSLPTGIAFSENENFATSPGVFDANHDGGSPFTGPTLWSSDPLIYAQPSGGNGSHFDMLHESQNCMGIAHEVDNVFWVHDGTSDCVVRYDFVDDHGAGNSDHSDGIIRKYTGMGLAQDPTYHIASHLVLDKATNWLYIVDTGNDRVVRLDINSGTQTGTFTPYEVTAESSIYGGYTMEVFVNSGLTEPSGIDVIEDRMIVSDYATGQIFVYDISGTSGTLLNTIETGAPGIMGIKIGPDGKIWYVNAITNEVVRLDFIDATGIDESFNLSTISIYPNPADGNVLNLITKIEGAYQVTVLNATGQVLSTELMNQSNSTIDIANLVSGHYFIQVLDINTGSIQNEKFVVAK